MFKALMGGGRDDASSRSSRRKSTASGDSTRRQSKRSSASSVSSSRRSTRGDDRDRALEDISASRSVTGDSTTTYVTAEPQSYAEEPVIIERTPKYIDRDDDQTRTSRNTERDSKKKERRDTQERLTRDDREREHTRTRTRSGDDVDPSSSSKYAPVSPGDTTAHFAAEIGNPGFNQFPMQFDSTNIPSSSAPYRPPLDSHVSQQFPGQLPLNPAGLAADYYNDQGQSVAHQPGVRPQAPDIIVGAQPHLQPASPMANPPPEPSSLGQVGAAAEYYAAGDSTISSSTTITTTVRPPKPGKTSKPSKPSSRPSKLSPGASIAAESATYGIGSELLNQASSSYPLASGSQSRPPTQSIPGGTSSQNGIGMALGGAAAGAAAAYMINHHDQSNSNAQQHTTQLDQHNETYGIGIPPQTGNIVSSSPGGVVPYPAPGHGNRPQLRPPSYSSGGMQPGTLAYHQRHHGPLSAFVDFWRDPEGVGKFEDYTQAIGVCKYCFEPGTTSRDAPRKHHYHQRRRSPVVERYGSSSRVDKLTRYPTSEDESRRKKSKGGSWLAAGLTGGLAGYVAKSLFNTKDFEDTYSVRSGERTDYSRRTTYEEGSAVLSGKASSTSRGVVSSKPISDDRLFVTKESKSSRYSRRSSRSRSRSRSRDRRVSSGLKEAALGAAVGSALSVAGAGSVERNRSRSRSPKRYRRRASDSSGSVYLERSRRRGRSSPKGFRSFFTAPSANRRKKSSKKERGFFSFGNSSSSSGDYDLAFGGSELYSSTVSGRSGRSSRSSKSSKSKNIDAEILGLGLAATQLANSSSRKEISPRDLARPSRSRPTKIEDDEWEDADSSDSAVSQNMAYGSTAHFGSQESVVSGSSFWPWSSRKKDKGKDKLDRQYAVPPTNEYNAYPAEYGSYDGSSSRGSLQQVYPMPTGDPSRFDVVRMSSSSSPNVQPPLVRPGSIPLQQPQPVTPVSQSVYYPTATAPVFPDLPTQQETSSRDIHRSRRSNSSPVLPLVPLDDGPSPGILKRRSTAKDSATVSFDLTEEQAGRQQEVDRRNREREERRRDEFALLREEADELERRRERKERKREERRRREEAEAEEAAREAHRERRRKEVKDEESRKKLEDLPPQAEEKSSSWVTPVVVGAGAAAVAGVLAEKAFEDKESVSNQSRYEERREKRRSQRRSASESQPDVTEVSQYDEDQKAIDEDAKRKRIAKIAASRIAQDASTSPVYDSYQDFFLPEELRHREDHDAPSPDITATVPLASEQATRTVEPIVASDTEKPNPLWPPLVINIIQPTPPASHDGSVRDVNSPAPASEPSDKVASEDEVEPKPTRSTAGSRVSWGEHQTHEYEVESPLSEKEEPFEVKDQCQVTPVPESGIEDGDDVRAIEDEPLPQPDDRSTHVAAHSMPGSFDEDVEFTATLAAGVEIAGFDPTVVTDDETYYRKDRKSKSGPKDTYRAPAVESVEDLGDVISTNLSQQRSLLVEEENHDSHVSREVHGVSEENGDALEKTPLELLRESDRAAGSLEDNVPARDLQDESQYMASSLSRADSKKPKKSKRSSKTRDEIDIESEDLSRQPASIEYSDSKKEQERTSDGDDTGFVNALKKVQSAPTTDDWIEEGYKERRRKSKRRSTDRTGSLEDVRSVAASAPGADELEEYRSRKSSKRDEEDYEDDSRSIPDYEDGEKRRRRRHKRHSGGFDDTASVASSPAKIDDVREKRRERESSVSSKDREKDQEKKVGGFLSNLFGAKSSSEQRSSSSSGKRETRSEVGFDDGASERRRKKRSSGGRSSGGDGWEVSSEAAQSTMDLSQLGKKYDGEDGDDDSQSSRRRRREQKRRDKYEEIVDSARDGSEKERYTTAESADDNDDDTKQSFLGMRPEMPQVNISSGGSNSDNEGGASGLATKEALVTNTSSYSGTEDQLQLVQNRLRSRSVSPSVAEKTFELAPRSQSRPSSPGQGEGQESKPRRLSVLRSSDSPTAVPLHFRKPPTSPSSSKRVSLSSPSQQQQSPSSPRPGHRRPNSIEFKNVREIRPLWLVERHSSGKFDAEPEGPLPSLPSSKTSSRAPSVENLREAYDGNAVADLFVDNNNASPYSWGRKPVDLRISTDQLPTEEDDYLNSQQATPTAETFNIQQSSPPSIKKEKPKYEFHSPSELLQDPSAYQQEIPEPPESMERLPSVAGSDVGIKEAENELEEGSMGFETPPEESVSIARDGEQSEKKASGIASFLTSAGFVSVVDAAVSAAVDESHDNTAEGRDGRELPATDEHELESSTKDIDDKIPDHTSNEDGQKQERDTSTGQVEATGNFGDVVNTAVAAAVSSHDQTTKEDETYVSKDARKQGHSSGGIFAGIVDAAVAATVGKSAVSHAEHTQPDSSRNIGLQLDDLPEQKVDNITPVEELNFAAEEPTSESATQVTSSSKKQKKKEKKKKKKSKDLGALTEDDDGENAAAVPAVEIDSPAQAQPEPEAERAEPAEPTNEAQTAAEEEIAPEPVETKQVLEIPVDQPIVPEANPDVEGVLPEPEQQPLSIVETEQTEAVIASVENDTRPGPSAEQETRDANDQAPHVAAEPADESFSLPMSKSQKKKNKKKKKSQSLSEPEPIIVETSPAAPVDEVAGPSATYEPEFLDQVEKPLPDVASTGMSSEQVDNAENEPGMDVPQNNEGQEKKDDSPAEAEWVEEQSSAVKSALDESENVVPTIQDSRVVSEVEQQRSLENVAEEVAGQEEITELPPTEATEVVQEESDKLAEASEALQQIDVEEPVNDDQISTTLPQMEAPVAEEPVDFAAAATVQPPEQPSEEKEEEQPVAAQSGKKSKNKKKKKKGKSSSVDEGPSEVTQDVSEIVTPQSEITETASAKPIAQTDQATARETPASVDPEISRPTDIDNQSKETEEANTEGVPQEAGSLPADAERVNAGSDMVEAMVESECVGVELSEATESAQPDENSVSAPEQAKEATELIVTDASLAPISSEGLALEKEAASSDKQLLEEIQAAEAAAKEDQPPATNEESPEPVSFAPVKSKKKKGKKGKRASLIEEPEIQTKEEPEATTITGESESTTPLEHSLTAAVDDTASTHAEPEQVTPAENEPAVPAEVSLLSTTLEETTSTTVEAELPTSAEEAPVEVEAELPITTDATNPPSVADAEPSTVADDGPVLESQPIQEESGDLTLPQRDQQIEERDTLEEQSPPQESEPSQTDKTVTSVEVEAEDFQVADSKNKRKKDKKKEKKKQKGAEVLPWDEDQPDKPTSEDVTEPVETPTPAISELVESMPIQQSTVDEQKKDVKEDDAESQPSEIPIEEAKPVDVVEDDAWTQETSKSKKKKDKKKKMAAAELDEEPSDKSGNDGVIEPVEAPTPEYLEKTEPTTIRELALDEQKTDDVTEKSQPPETSAETPAEEAKPIETVEDDTWIPETSKSKKKKDKKKKKAMEALPWEDKKSEKPVVEDSTELAVAPGTPEDAESTPTERAIPDEQRLGNAQESQPVQSYAETLAETSSETFAEISEETPTEETKPVDVVEDDSWMQESSKSKKKKDKKKKKSAEILLDEEQSDKLITEDATTELVEPPALENLEQSNADEEKAEIATEDISAEPQPLEAPVEEAKAVEITEDDGWTQDTSSKSKKKKDKKKKKAAETLSWDEDPSNDNKPYKDNIAEIDEVVAVESSAIEEGASAETQSPEASTEEAKATGGPEDDEWSQETHPKLKKKGKKKKRQSTQPEAAQEEDTRDVTADEIKDTPEVVAAIESSPVVEDTTTTQDEQNNAGVDDLQPELVPEDESLPPQPENLEEESSKTKPGKSKKKKGKKNKSKDEPMPWDVEPAVQPESQTEAVTDEPIASNEGASPDAPNEQESTEPIEEIAQSTESLATMEVETMEGTNIPSDELIEPQSTEPADSEDVQVPVENAEPSESIELAEPEPSQPSTEQTEEESTMPADLVDTKSSEDAAETIESTEVEKFIEPDLVDSSRPAENNEEEEAAKLAETTEPEASRDPVETTEPLGEGNELSRRKSGKKSKKKKNRDSIQWDEPSPVLSEQQDTSAAPPAADGSDETGLQDSSRHEKSSNLLSTEETQTPEEIETDTREVDPVDADADEQTENLSAAAEETSKPLSAKEKRKQKKRKGRSIDLTTSEPDIAGADETADVLASVEQTDTGEKQQEEAASDEFAVIGKKKGKKDKRKSVSWEDDIIQAAIKDEPKQDESKEIDDAEAVEELALAPPPNENIDSSSELPGTESVLQETPVEVDGKETIQSSDETYTDKKEKDFDWTDNMVSPQVHSQKEESPFPVPSPTFDNREDTDLPSPVVDDFQSAETVIPDSAIEDQPWVIGKERDRSIEQLPAETQAVDPEAEDIDWTTMKTAKGGKSKKKKKQKSISFEPEEPIATEEDNSTKPPIEADDKSGLQDLPDISTGQVTEPSESLPTQDVLPVSESPQQLDIGAAEEFKDVSSSKKKGKKKEKKADTWSFADIGEPVGEDDATNPDQELVNPPTGEIGKEIPTDNDENQVQEDPMVASERQEKHDLKDVPLDEAPILSQEDPQNELVLKEDNDMAAASEPPSRKLSKKEKRKQKNKKKTAEFEEEEPTAVSIEQEYVNAVNDEKAVEAVEENVDNAPANIGDISTVDDQPTKEEHISKEPPSNIEEQQVMQPEAEPTPIPAQEEPFVRKLSKKEKENNKRVTEEFEEDKGIEVGSTDIGGQLDDDVTNSMAIEEGDTNRGPATEASAVYEEAETANVSLDPFDMPEEDGDDPTDHVSPSADLDMDFNVMEPSLEERQDAEAAMRARALEKEADLDVAVSLFEDSPAPEQVVSRQPSKKQKGKKNKKDKRASQQGNDNFKDATEPQDSRDNLPSGYEKDVKPDDSELANDQVITPQTVTQTAEEILAREEGYDAEPRAIELVEKNLQSWPSVEFVPDSDDKYNADRWTAKDDEPEPEHLKVLTQDPDSMIDDFSAENVRDEAPRLQSDTATTETEVASQLYQTLASDESKSHELNRSAADETKSTSSQSEDVDIAVETAMAAAGFLPTSVERKMSIGAEISTETRYKEEKSKNLASVYEQGNSVNDTRESLEGGDLETTRGRTKANKIANLFPGLERVTYRRPSPKSHEKQAHDVNKHELPPSKPQSHSEALKKTPEAQTARSLSVHEFATTEIESTSKDRSSSLLFDSSPSTRLEPTPETTRRDSSPTIRLVHKSSGSLHRTKSIHGHHGGRPHSWQLDDDELTPTKRASHQSPVPLHSDHTDLSPPRTPLHPIKENEGSHVPSQSPRLVMGEGPYVLERPDSRGSARSTRPLRKANRSISDDLRAVASQDTRAADDDWPSEEKRKAKHGGRQDAGWAAPSATDRSQPPDDNDDNFHHQHLENIPSSSTYDPVTDKGKRPVRGMTDVYEAWGETPNSPRSPTRPPSVRRRQSMQHLQELESRLDQLISENRLLAAAKEEADQRLSRAGIARRKSDQALNTSNADLRDKEAEIARLKSSLEWMQTEVQRLTQENESIHAAHVELTASHAREVDGLRTRQIELATGMEGIVRDQIGAALAEKDVELRRLRDELAAARQTVQELQQQIVAATADDVLSIRDEDYFDNACQRLCQHVQQWVLRFSKHSDMRRCRPLAEVRNTNVADRFDNAILDGSDLDTILADRVRRRDVFVAVVMAMIWEYIFTRYLFGMDREQRQKLKALEKQLSDIGPRRAVAHWRALTLTLLAKRPSFAEQRVKDTEAVALEIMESLSQLLPPPQSAQSQLLESLRGVLRRAANLSIEMRTQRAEYVMLPPLQPEYDSQGDLARQVSFNASLMNERSGIYSSNDALEAQSTAVRLVLFPLVVKKGNDLGDGDEEIVVCPAQVLVAWPENERSRERDRISTLGNRSVSSVVPSVDMGNVV